MRYYTITKAQATIRLERQGSARMPYIVSIRWANGASLSQCFDTYDLADAYARAL